MTDADLERLLVLDAADGPALPIDRADADSIIDAALTGAGFGPGGGGGSAAGSTGAKLAMAGGAALLVAVVVFIATRDKPRAQVAAVTPDAAMIDAPVGTGSAIVEEDITIEPTTPVAPKREAKKPAKAQPPSVDDLLGEANAKRAEKQWRESDLLYGRVVERAPKSLAAQTALVASGSLHLEHLRDPRGAAKRFRRALELAPSGPVAEDARWGLAEAARALRDDKAEAAALDDFITHHAASPLAARAKARRAELP